MSLYYFVLGFLSAFAAGAALIFFGGAKTRPLLQKRLEQLREERRTTRAKAVKASLSVDKFKVTSIEAVHVMSTPAHISTSGVPCRLNMIGGAITLSTAYALRAAPATKPGSPSTETEPAKRVQDRAIATISAKNVKCSIDAKNRAVIHLVPKEGVAHICEATDMINGETKTVAWRALTLAFEGGPREADRWNTVLNPSPAAERWLKFTKSIPEGSATSFNLFVARILFENSAGPTLDEFISAKIRKKLSHVKLPPPLVGSLELVDLHFGDDSPFFTNTSFTGFAGTGEFGFDLDLLYRGGLTLMLSVTLQIGPLKVPNLVLEIKIGQIKGRLHMSIGGPPSNKMWVGFHEQPDLSLELKQDIHLPAEAKFLAAAIRGIDISEIVSEVVKAKLFEDMILPVMDDLPIPDLGPTPPSSPTTPMANPAAHPPQLSDWTDVAPDVPKATAAAPATTKKTDKPAALPPPKPIVTKADADEQLKEHLAIGSDAKRAAPVMPPAATAKAPATPPPAAATDRTVSPAKSDAAGDRHESRRERIEHGVEEKAAELKHAAHEVRERVAKIIKSRSTPPPEEAAAAKPAAVVPETSPKPAMPTKDAPVKPVPEEKIEAEQPEPADPKLSRNDQSSDSIAAPAPTNALSGNKSPPSVTTTPMQSGGVPPSQPQHPRPASSASDGSWVKDVSHTEPSPLAGKKENTAAPAAEEPKAAEEPPVLELEEAKAATPDADEADVMSGEPMSRADTAKDEPAAPAAKKEEPPQQQANTYMRPRYAQSQPQW